MRLLVYEFVTGGGLAGEPVPRGLAREGLAMRTALVEDLAAIARHQIVVAMDERFIRPVPGGVEVVARASLDALADASDAVWLIAPETNRWHERLAARLERRGVTLLGSGATAVRRAADKSRLPRRLTRAGIRHPRTAIIAAGDEPDSHRAADGIGYPVVIKPARGAGCAGVRLVRRAGDLRAALAAAHRAHGTGPLVLQEYVRGRTASVSLLADGRRAVPLAVNGQTVTIAAAFTYVGGTTPLRHALAERAAAEAVRACTAIPGLRGYVGVDLVLNATEPVVIEVNPRLTTSYLGVRAALRENVAALTLDACDGRLPVPPQPWRRARFGASGRVACR